MSETPRDGEYNYLLSTMDAAIWAKAFCGVTHFADEGWALAWMANAIMTGYDHGLRKAAQMADDAGYNDAAEAIMPGWGIIKSLGLPDVTPPTSPDSPCDVPTILAMMCAADAHMDALRAAVERLAAENTELRTRLERPYWRA